MRYKAPAYLALLPLALALLPTLQVYRVHVSRLELQEVREQVDRLARVEHVNDDRIGQQRYQILEKQRVLNAQLERLPEREVLAWVGLLAALGGLGVGGGLLLRLRSGGRRARASIEALQAELDTGWRSISRLVVLHGAMLLGAMLATGLYEVSWSVSHRAEVGWVPVAFLLPLWSGVVATGRLMLASLRTLGTQPPWVIEVQGRVLSEEAAPAVWRWVRSLAKKVGAPAPDQLVVGIAEGFFVTSAPVQVQPRGGRFEGRTLYLPLTFLSVLDRDEASSIVGHELGHFAAADTERGTQLALAYRRVHQRIDRLLAHQEEAPSVFNLPSLWTLTSFADTLEEAFGHYSRIQELRADALGARATSAEAAACALLRVTAVSGHVDAALDDAQRTPGRNAVTALLDALAHEAPSLSEEQLAHAPPHPVDTHPPTPQRLEALAVPITDALIARATRRPEAADTTWFQSLLSAPASAA